MIATRSRTGIFLLKNNILSGRARIAAIPRGAFISNSARQGTAFKMATAGEASKDNKDTCPVKDDLPPLTDHEFKNYNRLAEKMNWFVSDPNRFHSSYETQ
jgi:hypothetical protein